MTVGRFDESSSSESSLLDDGLMRLGIPCGGALKICSGLFSSQSLFLTQCLDVISGRLFALLTNRNVCGWMRFLMLVICGPNQEEMSNMNSISCGSGVVE